jgi:methyl-accepting chemotaxis protein
MRLRTQLLVAGCGTALICGAVGTGLIERRASDVGMDLLDRELQIGQVALERQWTLQRAERLGVYEGIARQPYFRAYLSTGDQGQMGYFAEAVRRAGADAVAILDGGGHVVAESGAGGRALAQASGAELQPDRAGLIEIFRIPVGGEPAVGTLLVGKHVDQASLRAAAEPFGIEVALATGPAFVSTLPPRAASAAAQAMRAGRLRGHEIGDRGERHRARLATLGGAQLLVAVPVSRVGSLTTGSAVLVGWLLVLIVIVAGTGTIAVMGRVAEPIERLKRAAEHLGSGSLASSASALRRLAARHDEIGALARSFLGAAEQLASITASCSELSRDLHRAIHAVDRSAASLANGAGQQEMRLRELGTAFGPLTSALNALSGSVSGAHQTVGELAVAVAGSERIGALIRTAIERARETALEGIERLPMSERGFAVRALRNTASRIEVALSLVEQQAGLLRELDESVTALRTGIGESLATHGKERQQRGLVHRAIEEIGHVAGDHTADASALRQSADGLRRQADHLNRLLSTLATQ